MQLWAKKSEISRRQTFCRLQFLLTPKIEHAFVLATSSKLSRTQAFITGLQCVELTLWPLASVRVGAKNDNGETSSPMPEPKEIPSLLTTEKDEFDFQKDPPKTIYLVTLKDYRWSGDAHTLVRTKTSISHQINCVNSRVSCRCRRTVYCTKIGLDSTTCLKQIVLSRCLAFW